MNGLVTAQWVSRSVVVELKTMRCALSPRLAMFQTPTIFDHNQDFNRSTF